MAQAKKPATTKNKKAAAKPAAKRTVAKKAAVKKVSTRKTTSKQSQLVSNDREFWLVISWIVLIALFLGIVVKAYVVG